MYGEIAEREGISEEALQRNISEGSVVVVKNAKRDIKPLAIGTGTRVKVNANIGTSPEKSDIREELEKTKIAVNNGAEHHHGPLHRGRP